jgi:uncharacterized protein (UPF0335 family)
LHALACHGLRHIGGIMSDIGHNSGDVDGGHLRAFIDRIERLEGEKAAISDDIREVYSEAKGSGLDPKIIRKVIALRKMDRDKRAEEEALLSCYLSALGELAETPLGRAAVARDFP